MAGAPTPEFWDGRAVSVTGGGGFLGKHVVAMPYSQVKFVDEPR